MANLPADRLFRRALSDPGAAQEKKLMGYLRQNAGTAFGKAFGFDRIGSYEEFTRRVPLSDYTALEPWIERICRGGPNVLTRERVTHLVPTSGSTGARKLIPFTPGLQREFNAAIGPWLLDLQRQFPVLLGGPAYWSITPPLAALPEEKASAIPIGFESDTAYLGWTRRRLAEAAMAVPAQVQRARTLEEFRYQTLLHLLCCRELRLISVWHPSFLTLLLDALPGYWNQLLDEIAASSLAWRARELRAIDPSQLQKLWPKLRLISCWGDGNAETGIARLKQLFPNAFLQRKGLLATEAVVTIPFAGQLVLAVTSHFFEFLDADGRTCLAHQLQQGEEYEIVVTTGGGLCRYRLQDRVRVTGYLQKTPALRFLARNGLVSDFCGEKLSDAFVAEVIRQLTPLIPNIPRFVLLAPDQGQSEIRYTIYLEGDALPNLEQKLDTLLRRNPHYSLCRDLGQLQPPALFRIRSRGYETFAARESANGKRLGDIKPVSLSSETGWSSRFAGNYTP